VNRRPRKFLPPEADSVPLDERATMVAWMQDQIAEIKRAADLRVELARTMGEHPMPLFGQLVQHYAGMQLEPTVIAKMLMIPYSVLMLHYEDDLTLGAAHVKLKIAENMVRIATSTTDKDAAKVGMDFLGRVNKNFRSSSKVEVEAGDTDARVIDSSLLTVEQRQQLREMIEATMRRTDAVDVPAEEEDSAQSQPGAGLGLLIGS
jgi:hypothetical protein